jgi:sugar lactone lactonase YvrE
MDPFNFNLSRFLSQLVVAFALPLAAPQAIAQTAPLIGGIRDQVIAQNTDTGELPFVVGDAETSFSSLTVSAASSNATLVPSSGLTLGGGSSGRTLKVTPAAGQTGTATITVSVADGGGQSTSTSFTLTVTAPNTKPTVAALSNQLLTLGAGAGPAQSFTIGDAETAAGSLAVSVRSSNPALVPATGISLGGGGANRSVTVTPASGKTGAADITLVVTDALGSTAESSFLVAVHDPAAASSQFARTTGLYILDGSGGSQINGVSMRDGNIRDVPFVDGYVLRAGWEVLEPSQGVYDFTIIRNIFTKLPANQKLSLIVGSSEPAYVAALAGVATYQGQDQNDQPKTRPVPWDATARARWDALVAALAAAPVDGVALRDHPRLLAVNFGMLGGGAGIRDPLPGKLRDLPGYTRAKFQNDAVLPHLRTLTTAFPAKFAHIGFFNYTDSEGGTAAWDQVRQAILAEFNGTTRPRVGFFQETLAGFRPAPFADPLTGTPPQNSLQPEFLSRDGTPIVYQMLGSWARPFNSNHVDNTLNGTPGDAMQYGLNDYFCRYHEIYVADVDTLWLQPQLQRWRDLLAALPSPGATAPPSSPPPSLPAAPAPANAAVTTGHDITLSTTAVGAIQWQVSTNGGSFTNLANDATYSGVTTTTLTIHNAGSALNGALYRYTVTAAGATATSAGATLTVVAAFFPFPVAVAVDTAGNFFVADSASDTVQKISAAGQVTAFAGATNQTGSADGTGEAARFNDPSGLAVDSAGTVSIADTANATLRRATASGVVTTLAGSATDRGNTDAIGAAARFTAPVGLAQDAQGNLFVADSQNHTIRRVTTAGAVTTLAGTAGTAGSADGAAATARFNNPIGVAVDASGNVYVADTTNHTLRKITSTGTVSTLAGLPGVSGFTNGTGPDALFNRPGGLALDSAGNLYVADTGNSCLRQVSPAGVVTTLAGLPTISGLKDGTGVEAWFNQPRSIALESGGTSLLVADTGNAALRRVSLAGVVTTLALAQGAPTPAPAPAPAPTPVPTPAPAPAPGSSGGGGAPSPAFLAALSLLAALHRLRRKRRVIYP